MEPDNTMPKRYCYDFQDPPNALVSNGVEQIAILAACDEKPPIVCTLQRSEGVANEPVIFDEYLARGSELPARLPSVLSAPGKLLLRLDLGTKLGCGRTSGVYSATIDLPSSSPDFAAVVVPPLVVKISRPDRDQDLGHEAFFYEEMESIQGIVIPRFYGFFKGELPPGYALVWKEDVSHTTKDNMPEPSCNDSHSDCSSGDSRHSCFARETCFTYEVDTHPECGSSDSTRPISILVLERLSDKLPVGKELPFDIEAEILDMYSHLSYLGIDHIDIRHANILEAPICPPGWPSLMSPQTQNAYRFRLVDFDNSKKTNRPFEYFGAYYRDYVKRLLDGLKMGYIIEPWQF